MKENHPGGKPPLYNNAQELSDCIEEYYEQCIPEFLKDDDGKYILEKGQPIVLKMNIPTMTGLALHLGFCSRQSLYDYEKHKEYSYIIKKARLRIENSYEESLRDPSIKATGPIFALKNMGWKDSKDIELNTTNNEKPLTREEKIKKLIESGIKLDPIG